MSKVYLVWIIEEDCDGKNTYLDSVFAKLSFATQYVEDTGNSASAKIEEWEVKA